MTSRDFAYWLQGLFELGNPKTLNENQTLLIKKHLNMVFLHEIDPSMGDEAHQAALSDIHNTEVLYQNNSNRPQLSFPKTEEEAVVAFGPRPGPQYKFNMHGWYDPKHGTPKC